MAKVSYKTEDQVRDEAKWKQNQRQKIFPRKNLTLLRHCNIKHIACLCLQKM